MSIGRNVRRSAAHQALLVTGSLGAVSQIRPVPNLKLRGSTYQGPTTIMNLVSDGIDQLGVESINFMVHLPQYVQLDEDFNGTARMLETLSSVYPDIPADLAPTRRGQRQYRELSSAVERNSEASGPDPADGSVLRLKRGRNR